MCWYIVNKIETLRGSRQCFLGILAKVANNLAELYFPFKITHVHDDIKIPMYF